MGVTLEKGIRELTSAEMAEHREHVHAEARERISEVGGALRVSLNDLAVGSLREYIALSRHQLEMSEYVNVHTGSSEDPDDLWIQKIDWPTGQYHPFRMATRPLEQDGKALPPAWAVEQLRDVMWRVKSVGAVLGRSGKHLVATDADGITELSNHQCEIADFLRTGKFKKVPRRRKARYLGGDGTQSAETAQRVRELGEALKEYQGRIEIRTVREFIALSKHQCELAGMVIASEREMKRSPVFEVVGYEEAYGLKGKDNVNVDSRLRGNDEREDTVGFSPSCLRRQASSVVVSEKQKSRDSRFHGNDHADGVAGGDDKTNGGNPPLSPLKLRGDEGGLWASAVHSEQLERGNDHADGVSGDGGEGREDFVRLPCGPPRVWRGLQGHSREGRHDSLPSGNPFSGFSKTTNNVDPRLRGGDDYRNDSIEGHAKVSEESPLTLHGIILHPTGKPAENIRVQLDMGAKGQSIICLDEITDREGRFTFECGEAIRPPDNIIIRGELINRLMNQPLPEAQVHITIGGDDGRAFSAVTDYRGRFAAGDGVPEYRPPGEPLWTEVECDDGPQFYEWNMGWDDW